MNFTCYQCLNNQLPTLISNDLDGEGVQVKLPRPAMRVTFHQPHGLSWSMLFGHSRVIIEFLLSCDIVSGATNAIIVIDSAIVCRVKLQPRLPSVQDHLHVGHATR